MAVVSKITLDNGTTVNSIATSTYSRCSTGASTAAKTIGVTGWSETTLSNVVGSTIAVYLEYGNTASSPTLNVNSQGAHPLCYLLPDRDYESCGKLAPGLYYVTLVNIVGNQYVWAVMGSAGLPKLPTTLSAGIYALTVTSTGSLSWTNISSQLSGVNNINQNELMGNPGEIGEQLDMFSMLDQDETNNSEESI